MSNDRSNSPPSTPSASSRSRRASITPGASFSELLAPPRLLDVSPSARKCCVIVLEVGVAMVDMPLLVHLLRRSIERYRRLAARPLQAVPLHQPQVHIKIIPRTINLTPLAAH